MKVLRILFVVFAIAVSAAKESRADGGLLGSAAPRELWTQEDIKAQCESQWPGQEAPLRNCLKRSAYKVGRSKSQSDIDAVAAAREASAQGGGLWTQQDIDRLCQARWSGQERSMAICKERYKRRLNSAKTPADIQELDSAQ